MTSAIAQRSFRPLSAPSAQGFGLRARYTSVENVPTLFDNKFLVDRYSPKRAATIDWYSKLPPDRLLWRVVTNISYKQVNKAVLRNRLQRRWASAFAEALKRAGYYHSGRNRIGPKDGKNYVPGLKGTLEILIFSDRGISCPHRELIGASSALVKSLVRRVQTEVETQREEKPQRSTEAEADVSSSLWSKWRKLLR